MTKDDFHDAVLRDIRFDWRTGNARLHLTTHEGDRWLLIEGVSKLDVSRQAPWGHSININSLAAADVEGGVRLLIELQSGDPIEIHGERLIQDSAPTGT